MNLIDKIEKTVEEKIERFSSYLSPEWSRILDPSYIPSDPKHRELEIQELSLKLVDSVKNRVTRNILVYGNPGTGKTMSFILAKNVAEKVLKKKGVENFKIIYTRASNTGVTQVFADICWELNKNVPRRGLSVREYMDVIQEVINESGTYVHICVDEFDNLLKIGREYYESMLYFLTRTKNVSATLITNRVDLSKEISDGRVISTLDTLNTIYFKPYTKEQVRDILGERIKAAFAEGVITEEALEVLAKRVAEEGGDIRKGLTILLFCGEQILKEDVVPIRGDLMLEIIQKYDVMKDGELLRTTLPLSDKIVLAALYTLLMEEIADKVSSEHLFAKQDYYRRVLGKEGISSDSFSVYLSRLSSAGVISVKRVGRGKGRGTESYVQLRYPTSSVRYMIETDSELAKLLPLIQSEIEEARRLGARQKKLP